MGKWEVVSISDIAFFQEGPGVRNTQYTTFGVKLLNVANLQEGKVDLTTSYRYISEDEAYGKYKHFLVDANDFIIASSGIQADYFEKKMGFVSQHQLPLCMNTSTIRFKSLDDKRLHMRYFMYCLKTPQFKEQLKKQITGSAQLNFGPSHIKKMTVPLPPLAVQQQIADVLDRASALIEKRKAQIAKLDLLIKSQFIEMFGDPVTNPMGWEKDQILHIASKIGSGATPRGGRESYKSKGISFIRSMNVYNCFFKFDDLAFLDNKQASQLDNVVVKENDVLLNITGASVARVCLVPSEILPARVNQHVSIIRA